MLKAKKDGLVIKIEYTKFWKSFFLFLYLQFSSNIEHLANLAAQIVFVRPNRFKNFDERK